MLDFGCVDVDGWLIEDLDERFSAIEIHDAGTHGEQFPNLVSAKDAKVLRQHADERHVSVLEHYVVL
jgi:hypothetical protein